MLRRVKSVGFRAVGRNGDGLLAAPDFALALAKERARTDRGGPGFSMLALTIDAAPDSPVFQEAAGILASLLLERTRLIDTKGWFGERVAVILPQTPADRIQNIWPPIKEAFDRLRGSGSAASSRLPEVRCEVYAYPCDGEVAALRGRDETS